MAWLITSNTMKQVFYLVIPQHALIFQFFFFSKIFYHQDSLISYFRFFNAEFKIFSLWSINPMESNKFFFLAFQDFSFLKRTIPGKIENIVSFIHFISEPFLQTSRSGKKFVQNAGRTSHRVLKRIQLFTHLR